MKKFRPLWYYKFSYNKHLEKITHLQMLLSIEELKLFKLIKTKKLIPVKGQINSIKRQAIPDNLLSKINNADPKTILKFSTRTINCKTIEGVLEDN